MSFISKGISRYGTLIGSSNKFFMPLASNREDTAETCSIVCQGKLNKEDPYGTLIGSAQMSFMTLAPYK